MLLVPYPSDSDVPGWTLISLNSLAKNVFESFPRLVFHVRLTPLLDAIVLDPGVLDHREGNTHNLLPYVWDLSCYRVNRSLDFSTNSSNNVSAEIGCFILT